MGGDPEDPTESQCCGDFSAKDEVTLGRPDEEVLPGVGGISSRRWVQGRVLSPQSECVVSPSPLHELS